MVKPVAWMSEYGQFIGKVKDEICHIPLYTTPRELSDELPSPVLQEYFEKGYKCAMESLQLSDEEKEKAKTQILANPDIEQNHLNSNESISQPVAYMETDTLLKWLIPVYPSKGTQLYTAPRELSDEEIIEIGNAVVNLIDSNEGWIEFAKAILKKASER